ncbi:exosortase/archaeosortase family protein, partial [Liquorilactobacillus nagelii]|uniref:exosortase/archaeosortase family protein n=3 Tax=Liquorilactobacillus TaxID=2767888 RepID=UPI0039E7C53A
MKQLKIKSLWVTFSLVIFVALAVPISIQLNLLRLGTLAKLLVKVGNGEEWIQFWGSYLGTLISIPVTITIALLTLKYEQRNTSTNNEIKRQNLELDNIMKAATKYQVDIEEFKHFDFDTVEELNYYSVLSIRNVVSRLFNENKKEFLLQVNLSRAKLPMTERTFADKNIASIAKTLKNSEESMISVIEFCNGLESELQMELDFHKQNYTLMMSGSSIGKCKVGLDKIS